MRTLQRLQIVSYCVFGNYILIVLIEINVLITTNEQEQSGHEICGKHKLYVILFRKLASSY